MFYIFFEVPTWGEELPCKAWDFGNRLWSSPIRLELGLPSLPKHFIWSLFLRKKVWCPIIPADSAFYQNKLGEFMKTTLNKKS